MFTFNIVKQFPQRAWALLWRLFGIALSAPRFVLYRLSRREPASTEQQDTPKVNARPAQDCPYRVY